jgi:hypothetical protein
MKLVEFKTVTGRCDILLEDARIHHLEDFVLWNGSQGAREAVAALGNINKNLKSVTIKWDGAVGVIFGRNPNGEFIFTDKAGFVAKGYDGRVTNPDDLSAMIQGRAKDDSKAADYKIFADKMKSVFPVVQAATPEDLDGYYKADILYFSQPQLQNNVYKFKPNVVTYSVKADSVLGKKIARSEVGIVIHSKINEQGVAQPMPEDLEFRGSKLLVMPPVTVSEPVTVDDAALDQVKALLSQHSQDIDSVLDRNKLSAMKVSDFAQILYSYVNNKVFKGESDLGRDFVKWLTMTSAVSRNKQGKIVDYVKQEVKGFNALWKVFVGIQAAKDAVIRQLDSQQSDVTASTNDQPGGEGYVIQTAQGPIKLVNRAGFSRQNFQLNR